MEQNKKIEKFFKKKFSSPVTEQDWNTPPDDTWDNILEGLEEKPKKKRRAIYIPWFLGILALSFAIYLWVSQENNSARIETLENKINNIDQSSIKETEGIDQESTNKEALGSLLEEDNIESNQGEDQNAALDGTSLKNNNSVSSPEADKINASNTSSSLSTTTNTSGQNNINNASNQKGRNNLSSANSNSGNQNQAPPNSVTTNMAPIFNQNGLGLSDTIASNIPQDKLKKEVIIAQNIFDLERLNSLMLAQMLLPIHERPQPIISDLGLRKFVNTAEESKQSFQLGLLLRQNNWIDKNTGVIDNPLEELLTQENTLTSLSYGVYGSANLNKKWTLNVGLLYNQRNHESLYFLQLPFSTATEMLDSEGELINAFQHSLPTSLGDVKTDVTLSRKQSSSLSNNEIVDIDLSFRNKTSTLIIPVTASYFPKGANNGLFISGGLNNEIILSNQLNGIQSESHHDTVNDKSVIIQYNDGQQNRYGLSASVGTGYVFNLREDLNLMLAGNYDFALSKNYTTAGYQHKIDNLSFGVGLMKVLGR